MVHVGEGGTHSLGYGEALVRPKSTTRCGCTVLVWRNGCSWSTALSSAPCSGPQPGFGTCGLEAGADFCVEPPVVAVAVMPLLVLVLQPICESVFPLPTQAEGGTGGDWGGTEQPWGTRAERQRPTAAPQPRGSRYLSGHPAVPQRPVSAAAGEEQLALSVKHPVLQLAPVLGAGGQRVGAPSFHPVKPHGAVSAESPPAAPPPPRPTAPTCRARSPRSSARPSPPWRRLRCRHGNTAEGGPEPSLPRTRPPSPQAAAHARCRPGAEGSSRRRRRHGGRPGAALAGGAGGA